MLSVGSGAASSLVIVPVAWARAIVALAGLDSVTVNVSSASTAVSPTMATAIVCEVVPAANVSMSRVRRGRQGDGKGLVGFDRGVTRDGDGDRLRGHPRCEGERAGGGSVVATRRRRPIRRGVLHGHGRRARGAES